MLLKLLIIGLFIILAIVKIGTGNPKKPDDQ